MPFRSGPVAPLPGLGVNLHACLAVSHIIRVCHFFGLFCFSRKRISVSLKKKLQMQRIIFPPHVLRQACAQDASRGCVPQDGAGHPGSPAGPATRRRAEVTLGFSPGDSPGEPQKGPKAGPITAALSAADHPGSGVTWAQPTVLRVEWDACCHRVPVWCPVSHSGPQG